MGTSAKVICDSVSESGVRLTTLVLEYPRIIHSEVMTHRQFSRNASSSRAIPVEKQIERIKNDPFIPVYWGKNQKGMQAGEETNEFVYVDSPMVKDIYDGLVYEPLAHSREEAWLSAKTYMVDVAEGFNKAGYHKQLVNRLLEPFSHIQVVVTATEWDNFFTQRLDKNAQPEIQELARVMKEAMDNSTPKELFEGHWHLPFISDVDNWEAEKYITEKTNLDVRASRIREVLIAVSIARCARVSYGLNERGWGDIQKDLALYDMLYTSGHWSPFEHQATPIVRYIEDKTDWWKVPGVTSMHKSGDLWSGNFKGWIQNRQLLQQSC